MLSISGFIFTLGNFGVYSPSNQNRGAYNYNSSAQFAYGQAMVDKLYFLTASTLLSIFTNQCN